MVEEPNSFQVELPAPGSPVSTTAVVGVTEEEGLRSVAVDLRRNGLILAGVVISTQEFEGKVQVIINIGAPAWARGLDTVMVTPEAPLSRRIRVPIRPAF